MSRNIKTPFNAATIFLYPNKNENLTVTKDIENVRDNFENAGNLFSYNMYILILLHEVANISPKQYVCPPYVCLIFHKYTFSFSYFIIVLLYRDSKMLRLIKLSFPHCRLSLPFL